MTIRHLLLFQFMAVGWPGCCCCFTFFVAVANAFLLPPGTPQQTTSTVTGLNHQRYTDIARSPRRSAMHRRGRSIRPALHATPIETDDLEDPHQNNENSKIASPPSSSSSFPPVTTSDAVAVAALPVFSQWLLQSFQRHYDRATLIPCPFFRRRVSDALDACDQLIRFWLIRHKSMPLPWLELQMGSPSAWRCKGDTSPKRMGIAIDDLAQIIRHDWNNNNNHHHHKGYYITGRLTHGIYRDDCFFDGPDPDMPVRGLRKYLNAASQLFEVRHSTAELVNLQIISSVDPDHEQRNDDDDHRPTTAVVVVAHWRLNGVLKLPWHPKLPELTGRTYYYPDTNGLIYRHVEQWDQSVLQAFVGTFWPPIQDKLVRAFSAKS
jgi:hypothetical protein